MEKVASVRVEKFNDEDPDLSWLEQECFNEATGTEPEGYGFRRIASHGIDWSMVGIVVTALCEHGGEIASESLWGIEDDWSTSSDLYFVAVALKLAQELDIPQELDAASWEWVDRS